MAYKRLGDILVSAGTLSENDLNEALAGAREAKMRIGEYLIHQGLISERQIIDALRLQLGIDFIDLTKASIETEMAALVPRNLAKMYSILPVKLEGETLYLAMVDPLNFTAIEDVKNATKKRVIPMIATERALERAHVMLYGNEGVNRAIDELQKERLAVMDNIRQPVVEEINEDIDSIAPAIRIVNSIIERGITEGASDIHIEPHEDGLQIRMRIDGVLRLILEIPQNLQNAVISRVKIMGDMDIAEKRVPLDGRSSYKTKDKDIDLRISSLPTKYGEKVVIRFLEKSKELLSIEGIGMQGQHLHDYHELLKNTNGVILISGPTGSGKSTTMYTMISELNREEVNLITLEDPIEYDVNGVNQVQVNEKAGLTFAAGLRSILRQDPDIISVGEIRDGETAEIAMRAAITGHLVLSTIHTNSAVATIDRLVDIGVEPYLIASALKGVLAQRLVRRICPACKEAYEATEEEVLDLGLDPTKKHTFYRGKGCPECIYTGYKGRVGLFEILVLNSEEKQLIREGAPQSELIKAIEKTGYTTLKDDALKLIDEGTTTASEAIRILHTTDF